TSTTQRTFLIVRNNIVMLLIYLTTWIAIIIICARLWIDLFAIIKFLVDRKGADAWADSRAQQYFFLHIFKNRKKRQHFATKANRIGTYKRSILWDFYANKIHRFSQLKDQNFRH